MRPRASLLQQALRSRTPHTAAVFSHKQCLLINPSARGGQAPPLFLVQTHRSEDSRGGRADCRRPAGVWGLERNDTPGPFRKEATSPHTHTPRQAVRDPECSRLSSRAHLGPSWWTGPLGLPSVTQPQKLVQGGLHVTRVQVCLGYRKYLKASGRQLLISLPAPFLSSPAVDNVRPPHPPVHLFRPCLHWDEPLGGGEAMRVACMLLGERSRRALRRHSEGTAHPWSRKQTLPRHQSARAWILESRLQS